jgi:hypothetical protein
MIVCFKSRFKSLLCVVNYGSVRDHRMMEKKLNYQLDNPAIRMPVSEESRPSLIDFVFWRTFYSHSTVAGNLDGTVFLSAKHSH